MCRLDKEKRSCCCCVLLACAVSTTRPSARRGQAHARGVCRRDDTRSPRHAQTQRDDTRYNKTSRITSYTIACREAFVDYSISTPRFDTPSACREALQVAAATVNVRTQEAIEVLAKQALQVALPSPRHAQPQRPRLSMSRASFLGPYKRWAPGLLHPHIISASCPAFVSTAATSQGKPAPWLLAHQQRGAPAPVPA